MGEQGTLYQWLESVGRELVIEDTHLSITIDDEKKIAEIIRGFNRCKTDIYRVEVKEPTLEEIFLDED